MAVLFYPPCFDIFTRLLRQHLGRVDLDGLKDWHHHGCAGSAFDTFPSHIDVRDSSEQWWSHKRGLEYLAANPTWISDLYPILWSSVHREPSFSTQNGAFDVPNTTPEPQDIFSTLPGELKQEVLVHLGTPDIANLRMASRSFRQLPILLWRRLLQEEMPWLWEVLDFHAPYKWATVSVSDLVIEEEVCKTLRSVGAILRQEMAEIEEIYLQGAKRAMLSSKSDSVAAFRVETLQKLSNISPTSVNWYEVYCGITRNY